MNCKIYNVGGADSTVATIGLSDESQVIAHVPYETPEDRANAEFIVRAVNSHDALLAALRECVTEEGASGLQEGLGRMKRRILAINDIARAAIAHATGNEIPVPAVSENLNQPLRRVENVRLPMCGHGFRSGYAYATVDGKPQRLHTSRHETSDYQEHMEAVMADFAMGKGESVDTN